MSNVANDIVEVQNDTNPNKEKKWCVYMHTNKINGKKYIGITSQEPENRWRTDGRGYKDQPRFWNAINKYGWDNFQHDILLTNETFEYACAVEQCLIKHYKSKISSYGYNLTGGGEGNVGWHHSDESKQKMREAKQSFKGESHPWYGRKHKQETKDALRDMHTGTKMSAKCKEKMSQAKMGTKNNQARLVYCIELNTIFSTVTIGASYVGISRESLSCHLNSKKQSAGKHPKTKQKLHWLYVYDQKQKANTVIQGAITLGHVTKEEINNYLKDLKEKETNIYGIMEEE